MTAPMNVAKGGNSLKCTYTYIIVIGSQLRARPRRSMHIIFILICINYIKNYFVIMTFNLIIYVHACNAASTLPAEY